MELQNLGDGPWSKCKNWRKISWGYNGNVLGYWEYNGDLIGHTWDMTLLLCVSFPK